jgi:predicted amidohydrolase
MLFTDTIIAISDTIDGLDFHSNDRAVQTVNTTGKIISPGLIDTHRHTWFALHLSLRLTIYTH